MRVPPFLDIVFSDSLVRLHGSMRILGVETKTVGAEADGADGFALGGGDAQLADLVALQDFLHTVSNAQFFDLGITLFDS
jgi:hypothetical protein